MTIIQECRAKDGNLKLNTIHNVTDFVRAEKVPLKKFNNLMSVIWLMRRGEKSFPLAFRDNQCRDRVYSRLLKKEAEVVILDILDDFFTEVWTQTQVDDRVTLRLSTHIKHCVSKLSEKFSIGELSTTDAFKVFRCHLSEIGNTRIVIKNESIIRTWAKTLYMPKDLDELGITPLQFFKTLTKNEDNYNVNYPTITVG